MANTLNLGNVKTPGVYVDEMSLFPPSVAQVDTAIPAFIGPTRNVYKTGEPVRIGSMAEYRSLYGGAPDRSVIVTLDDRGGIVSAKQNDVDATPQYLHDSLLLYFSNGGEKCYIVSTGSYTDPAPTKETYDTCLQNLEKFDEPTLIVIPDAVRLDAGDLGFVQQKALEHCRKMQDRFAILDVQMATNQTTFGGSVTTFREKVGSENLNYGAAYFPYLQTTIPLSVSYPSLTIKQGEVTVTNIGDLISASDEAAKTSATNMKNVKADEKKVRDILKYVSTRGPMTSPNPSTVSAYDVADTTAQGGTNRKTALTERLNLFKDMTAPVDTVVLAPAYTAATANNAVFTALSNSILNMTTSTPIKDANEIYARLISYVTGFYGQVTARLQSAELDLRSKSPLYSAIAKAAETQAIVLPPSGAIAGIYARTDANRGVWKSPANTSLNYVSGPIVTVTDSIQDGMNVDTTAGKSVNAIRAFSGKGTLVWGARTLAGSDNEWRYISVRRFFLMAEESIRKATAQFVFESNDANTWVRVRAMIENFLTLQWRAGALAGAKADQAFFVRVGLGQTMTPQDVLNGFMIIEIGMAAVRPAEFIVLRFSHKMQEA